MNRAAGAAIERAVSHADVFAPAGAFAAIAVAIIPTSFAPYGPKRWAESSARKGFSAR